MLNFGDIVLIDLEAIVWDQVIFFHYVLDDNVLQVLDLERMAG